MGGIDKMEEDQLPVNFMIITISNTHTLETDMNGGIIQSCLKENGYTNIIRDIIEEDQTSIHSALKRSSINPVIDIIILNDGYQCSDRLMNSHFIEEFFDYPIVGYGNLFQDMQLLEPYVHMKPVAGVKHQTAIFMLPGSVETMRHTMNYLIIPSLKKIVSHYVIGA
ncbi:hypothetical protein GLV99_07735 [Virgibacillus massiliensis]|nr:hypothetical protein [Virgibacillus massiliensis]